MAGDSGRSKQNSITITQTGRRPADPQTHRHLAVSEHSAASGTQLPLVDSLNSAPQHFLLPQALGRVKQPDASAQPQTPTFSALWACPSALLSALTCGRGGAVHTRVLIWLRAAAGLHLWGEGAAAARVPTHSPLHPPEWPSGLRPTRAHHFHSARSDCSRDPHHRSGPEPPNRDSGHLWKCGDGCHGHGRHNDRDRPAHPGQAQQLHVLRSPGWRRPGT